MTRHAWLLLAATAAFWPVWPWYARRVLETPDERVGLIALITALWFALEGRDPRSKRMDVTSPQSGDLWLPAILLWTYVLAFGWLPSLARAALAFLAVGSLAITGGGRFGRRMPLAFAGLLLLALPVMPSWQFYLGFPLRQLTTELSALLLQVGGMPVAADGAVLRWNHILVAVDAPCSGLRMAWTGGYLVCVLALVHRLDVARTLAAGAMTLGVVIAANVLRASSLFYLESGLIQGEGWYHQGVGLVVFAGVAAAIILLICRLAPAPPRPFRSSGRVSDLAAVIPLFLTGCVAAALSPFLSGSAAMAPDSADFPGWPATFEGRVLIELPLTEREQRFTAGFPGRVARFHDGEREIIVRWVARPTRKLHPASHCFAAHGYRIEPALGKQDASGRGWSALEAHKDGEVVHVREAVRDNFGQQWADVSAWYWAAARSRTRGPWWSFIVAQTQPEGSEAL